MDWGQNTMDTFDTFIIAVGVALVLVGLYLFISGKQGDGSRNSNVEGFGIKINVSNPSIILVVIGIGLILLPKFLPNAPDPNPYIPPDPINGPGPGPEPIIPVQPAVYYPEGDWYLVGYTQNGVDISMSVEANATFSAKSSNGVTWRMEFVATDMWGNMSQYFYSGTISHADEGYYFTVKQTNDPSIPSEVRSPLIMNLEDNGQLHLEYAIGVNNIIIHWMKLS